jgi:hypothetical protein
MKRSLAADSLSMQPSPVWSILGMNGANRFEPAIAPLTLECDVYNELDKANAREQLQIFARSTKIAVDEDRLRLVLCGTDLRHHDADPYLHDNVSSLPAPVMEGEYARFHARLPAYDLCMEDSWTGYFVSRCLTTRALLEPLVFIHLDDHTDMMPTLLRLTADGLQDPSSCQPFDPTLPKDWSASIGSGSVGIGSFVTALYYLPQPVHVVHLNHVTNHLHERYAIAPRAVTHPLLPHVRFAGIEKRPQTSTDQLGTYVGGADVAHLLRSVPCGRLIVHVDLDYFINDYNGNPGSQPALSVDELRENASELMSAFFGELASTGATVERWIIGASPGFCSARHWKWLLDTLSMYLESWRIDRRSGSSID